MVLGGYGPSVDYLAPAVKVPTTSYAGGEELVTLSSDSLGAAFVAGVVATFVGYQGLAGGDVNAYLDANSQTGLCTNVPESQRDRLVNTGINNPDKASDVPFLGGSTKPARRIDGCATAAGPAEKNGWISDAKKRRRSVV